MKTYKVAEGKSLVAKRRIFAPGEEIGADCFANEEAIAELLKNGSIVEAEAAKAEEAASEKKVKKVAKTETAEENGGEKA